MTSTAASAGQSRSGARAPACSASQAATIRVDRLDLLPAHLGQQVGEAGQVADQQPAQVALLVQPAQPGPGDHRQALRYSQGGEARSVGDEAEQLLAGGESCRRTPSASRARLDGKCR